MGQVLSRKSSATSTSTPAHTTIENSLKTMEEASSPNQKAEQQKKAMSFFQLMYVLRPFFWPSEGSDGATVNRLRATSTWAAVGLSKASSLIAPFYLSKATNSLAEGDFGNAWRTLVAFAVLRFLSSFLKEMQTILYIKVKQQASIELQEMTFTHLHTLSLTWHLTKKTGSVMKSMDRGVEASNQLITYLFLFLIPALAECLAVVILFFTSFRQWWLGILVFVGVSLYSIITILITQWRKKFREGTNKTDNDLHDKAQDSILK